MQFNDVENIRWEIIYKNFLRQWYGYWRKERRERKSHLLGYISPMKKRLILAICDHVLGRLISRFDLWKLKTRGQGQLIGPPPSMNSKNIKNQKAILHPALQCFMTSYGGHLYISGIIVFESHDKPKIHPTCLVCWACHVGNHVRFRSMVILIAIYYILLL